MQQLLLMLLILLLVLPLLLPGRISGHEVTIDLNSVKQAWAPRCVKFGNVTCLNKAMSRKKKVENKMKINCSLQPWLLFELPGFYRIKYLTFNSSDKTVEDDQLDLQVKRLPRQSSNISALLTLDDACNPKFRLNSWSREFKLMSRETNATNRSSQLDGDHELRFSEKSNLATRYLLIMLPKRKSGASGGMEIQNFKLVAEELCNISLTLPEKGTDWLTEISPTMLVTVSAVGTGCARFRSLVCWFLSPNGVVQTLTRNWGEISEVRFPVQLSAEIISGDWQLCCSADDASTNCSTLPQVFVRPNFTTSAVFENDQICITVDWALPAASETEGLALNYLIRCPNKTRDSNSDELSLKCCSNSYAFATNLTVEIRATVNHTFSFPISNLSVSTPSPPPEITGLEDLKDGCVLVKWRLRKFSGSKHAINFTVNCPHILPSHTWKSELLCCSNDADYNNCFNVSATVMGHPASTATRCTFVKGSSLKYGIVIMIGILIMALLVGIKILDEKFHLWYMAKYHLQFC